MTLPARHRRRPPAPFGSIVRRMGAGGATLLAGVISSCGPAPKAPPPKPVVQAPSAPAAPAVDWRDLPLSPGRWTYLPSSGNPSAQFARPGAIADFTITCDRKAKALILFRAGHSAPPAAPELAITTSYSTQGFPAQSAADGLSITLPATSEFLDRIAFSRGRISVAVAGLPLLVLPAWAEPARVIEDCRG